MFIEKISKAKKEEYIKNYVTYKNIDMFPCLTLQEIEEEDGAYKEIVLDDRDIEFAKTYGYDKYFENLEKENIFVRFYEYADEDIIHRYSFQRALIFIFGDTDVKIYDEHIGTRAYYSECCESVKVWLNKNLDKIKINDKLFVNKDYVTTFMAENVKDINEYINYIKSVYQKQRNKFLDKVKTEETIVLNKIKYEILEN